MTKTKKLLTTALVVLGLFVCSNVNAQSVASGKFRFGIGVDGLLPVGDVSNSENFGLGITPRLQYGIGNNTALTFTSGIYHFFPKNIILLTSPLGGTGTSAKYHLDIVPVKVGIKYFISSDFYLGVETGVGFEVEDGGGPAKLIASPAFGYASKHWDAGLRYEGFFGQSNNYSVLGLRIAYGFGL